MSACVEQDVCGSVYQTSLTLGVIAGVTKTHGGMHETKKIVHMLLLWSCWMLIDISRKLFTLLGQEHGNTVMEEWERLRAVVAADESPSQSRVRFRTQKLRMSCRSDSRTIACADMNHTFSCSSCSRCCNSADFVVAPVSDLIDEELAMMVPCGAQNIQNHGRCKWFGSYRFPAAGWTIKGNQNMKRTGWVLRHVKSPESVAGHMYRMGIVTFLLDDKDSLDKTRCLKLALVHDLAECIVGDITPCCGVAPAEKHQREDTAMKELAQLAGSCGSELYHLYKEYEEQKTPEARLVKELDRFDMILQAFEYEKAESRPRSLQEFFDSTNGKFSHPLVTSLVTELNKRRSEFEKEYSVQNVLKCGDASLNLSESLIQLQKHHGPVRRLRLSFCKGALLPNFNKIECELLIIFMADNAYNTNAHTIDLVKQCRASWVRSVPVSPSTCIHPVSTAPSDVYRKQSTQYLREPIKVQVYRKQSTQYLRESIKLQVYGNNLSNIYVTVKGSVTGLDKKTEAMGGSNIVEFFQNAHVLITGGTGFMGQVLMEKLLRTCQIDKLYLIVRPKKGLREKERVEKIFAGCLYDRVKREQPHFMSKVVLITGDMEKWGLGLSDDDRAVLVREVKVIFHCAATVRFDAKLRTAISINILGTKYMLDLAREMTHLKAFLHFSTAYSNCPRKEIGERFYSPPLRWTEMLQLMDSLDERTIDTITQVVIGKWPNTYAFTKAVAEDMVKEEARGLPVGILRPSIVVHTAIEPVVGWFNNLYGPLSITAGAVAGVLKSMYCNGDVVADVVPVDMAVNSAIAVAWDVAQCTTATKLARLNTDIVTASKCEDSITIFNYVSSVQNPVTWDEMKRFIEQGNLYPSLKFIWYYCFCYNKHRLLHNIYALFLHTLPAILADIGAMINGKQPRMWKMYQKIHGVIDVLAYFCTQEWVFSNDNVQKLWKRMNPEDQRLFKFDITVIAWEDLLFTTAKALRLYIMDDPIVRVEEAEARYRRCAHIWQTW
ncbi:hypothetical protein Cfor_08610, partial [Coptotermes formosanus]